MFFFYYGICINVPKIHCSCPVNVHINAARDLNETNLGQCEPNESERKCEGRGSSCTMALKVKGQGKVAMWPHTVHAI